MLRALIVAGVLLTSAAVSAQPRLERVQLEAGVRWIGAVKSEINADETAPGGSSRALFSSRTEIHSFSPSVRVGIQIVPSLSVEASFSYGRPNLTTSISMDTEGASGTVIKEQVTQYLAEYGLLVRPGRWRTPRRSIFVAGGAGLLRQLHDGKTLAETGQAFYVGTGVDLLARPSSPRHKTIGIRLEARAEMLQQGAAFDKVRRTAPAAGAALFIRY